MESLPILSKRNPRNWKRIRSALRSLRSSRDITSSNTRLKPCSSCSEVYELSNWQNIIRCDAINGLNSWTTAFESSSSWSV